jgi:type IV pilus assembly protein PilC
MPNYAYSAINAQGVVQAGEISATDLAAARDALRGSGLLADFLQELKAPTTSDARRGMFGRTKKVKAKSLQIFSRQFATMIEAGLSVVTALVVLEQQTDDAALGAVIDDVRERVEGGAFLSEAMSQHPDTFNRLYISMVEAGEAAGVLDTVLDRVATQIEKEEKIKRRVKGAMICRSSSLICDPRPRRNAHVSRSGLPEDLRHARRRPADTDAVHRPCVERTS